MPISRDARTDRRRRLLRDTAETETGDNTPQRRNASRTTEVEEFDGTVPKRKAGYSQDVRKACSQRLVQLIPVRRRSFAAVILVSLLIPGLLLAAHYMIHVSGQLQWWRHPLAIALDVGHPRSIAAWLCSQLWLLCLGATVLTFQLRRHKLDDYNGEYRLWFWLVLTCLIASVDATTSITSLFALALDPWAQTRLGWSGPAVVDSTMAVLIGMLGLRMCGELKSVPSSLVCWLLGLVLWSGSAALARPEFLLEMSAPIRYWLTAALWISGLTMIWLAALTYLRNIYIEAQQRFLLRGHLATSGIPLGQRLRQSLPNMPRFRRIDQSANGVNGANGTAEANSDQHRGSRWSLLGFMRPRGQALNAESTTESPKRSGRSRKQSTVQQAIVGEQRELPGKSTHLPTTDGAQTGDAPSVRHETSRQERPAASGPIRNETASPGHLAELSPRRGLGGFFKSSRSVAQATTTSRANAASESKSSPDNPPPKSRFGGWLRRGKHSDDAEEFRKVVSSKDTKAANPSTHEQRASSRNEQHSPRATADTSTPESAPRTARRWLPKLSRPKLAIPSLPRPKLVLPKFSRSKSTTPPQPKSETKSLLSRFKLPSFSLSALKLQPPNDAQFSEGTDQQVREMRPAAAATRPLPGTTPVADQDEYFDEEDNDGRPMSKAERKRLRRNQQQRRSA
jgi:hypothetical protein